MEPQTKVCPICAAELPATAKTCSQCQASFEVKVTGYCFTCHELATADPAGNCLRCGNAVIDPRVESKLAITPTISPLPYERTMAQAPPAQQPAPSSSSKQSTAAPYEPAQSLPDLGMPAIGSLDDEFARPGSSIDNQLLMGEKIVHRTRLHGLMFVSALFSLLVGAGWYYWTKLTAETTFTVEYARLLNRSYRPGDTVMDVYPEGMYFMYFLAFLILLGGLRKLFTFLFTEIAITNQRLLGRLGGIIPRRIDIPVGSIASVIYSRGLGNQGRVTVNYLPRRMLIIPYVPRPAEFYQRLHTFMPARAPTLERVNIGRVLLVVLLVLLIIAGGVLAAYYFTEGKEALQPVAEANLYTIDQYNKGRRVTIEGYLEMPASVSCDKNCNLYLVDYQNPTKNLIIFVDLAEGGAPKPGEMKRLPLSYSKSDLAVALADGGYAGHGTDVRLTGTVCETTRGNICLNVTHAESGRLPDTQTPTPGPTFTSTLSPTPTRTRTPTRTLRPTKTQTPIPSITPTPMPVTFANVCDYVNRLVIVQGRLSVSSFMTFCSGGRCSLYLKDPAGTGKQLRITIRYTGKPNEMEPLPDKYTTSNLKVHTADDQVVGYNRLVRIMGKVSAYDTSSTNMLKCSLQVITVNLP